MMRRLASALLGCALLSGAVGSVAGPAAEFKPAASISAGDLIQAAELASALAAPAGRPPTVLQVGSKVLYDQAHIPDADYAGPGNRDEGLAALRGRVAKLPKDAPIVLYCGCCPWTRCPNVAAAFDALRDLGYTQVRVLYLPNNFGDDWVAKGYPVARSP